LRERLAAERPARGRSPRGRHRRVHAAEPLADGAEDGARHRRARLAIRQQVRPALVRHGDDLRLDAGADEEPLPIPGDLAHALRGQRRAGNLDAVPLDDDLVRAEVTAKRDQGEQHAREEHAEHRETEQTAL
jgi:hypothetical protein